MDLSYDQQPPSSRRYVGLGAVVALHVLLAYALATGLARNVIDIVKKPLDTKIILELPPLPPPPPPPPPPKEIVKPQAAPKAEAAPPPPAFVPPPEIASPTETHVLQATQAAPATATVEIKPPAEVPVAQPQPDHLTADGSCPGYAETLRKAFTGLYDKHEVAGTVTVRVLVRGSTITKVSVLSGPREYHRAVIAAVSSLSCQVRGSAEGYFDLPIVFRED